jgi:hypothetical protein
MSQTPDPQSRSLRNREANVPYQAPEDHELSPEVQLAWFELNREQTQRAYVRVMRTGGLLGALILPLVLLGLLYAEVEMPLIHEVPATNMICYLIIGAFSGFLIGVGFAALAFWLLQSVE